jgi:hypothetical protein
LDRRRWHSCFICSRRCTRTSADRGYHRRRTETLSTLDRSLPRGTTPRWAFREKLIVSLHAIGFLGETTQQATEDFYPGYAHTFTEIGKERGWPPATRAQFDALRGPSGALLIGDADTVAQNVLYVNEALGGLSRITFQMGVSALPQEKMLRSIELLGTGVAPVVDQELRPAPESRDRPAQSASKASTQSSI